MQPVQPIAEGQRTRTIYTLIKDQKYKDAINYLNYELQFCPKSRALSLLAYCHYMNQDFSQAVAIYEQLVKYYPEIDDYKIYLAQSYYKDSLYDEALKICASVENTQYQGKILQLQALIRYEKNEFQHAKTLLKQNDMDDPDSIINEACILFKENKFEEARQRFQDAMNLTGYSCELSYNIALCYYKQKQLAQSLKFIAEIIERGVREHPQLGVGSNAEGIEVKSVGNSQALKESALIEAFNLKAAIEYTIKNYSAAKEALIDMPPREEDELDPVSLMNQALMNIEEKTAEGFKKLNHLLQNPPFPPETFSNLLLLYCKYGYFDMAADILAENADLTFNTISQDDFEFVDALILTASSPEESFRKFQILSNKHIDTLRRITKSIQDARLNRDNEGIKKSLKDFDECLEKYIPVLMAQAKIYWDKDNYQQVEKLFRQSAEFCADHDVWKLNVAHVFYVQDNKYREAIRYYEPIVKKNNDNLLSLTAIVIANLCVSYIMVNQNEDAEELMRKLEAEEQKSQYSEPDKPVYHLCIVNLVIGTLYCSKNNYEFGVSRVIKSLEPYNKKINTDTWYYAKRCFLALIEVLAKHMIILKDTSYSEILDFLDAADSCGKAIPSVINPLEQMDEKHTVSYEARMIKRMFLKLRT
ncbi:unnamed protein product [Paramecium primaurelia]|uniref:Tetratricopeptide repeat protein 30 n=1 Tax=Paramecium primaurelia TaxID=5886 RepID=A0A8S1MRR2_PARPR|nr:unnamed protein product [Paramecium primaurelia]